VVHQLLLQVVLVHQGLLDLLDLLDLLQYVGVLD
jgi:hypothetical protein